MTKYQTNLKTRLAKTQARKLVSLIVSKGKVSLSKHAREEMNNDNLTMNDVINVLAGGHITEEGELEHGSWRYRVHTNTICVVVVLRSQTELVVVTAWRKTR